MERLENNLKDEKTTKEEEELSNFFIIVSFLFSVIIGAVCFISDWILERKLKKYQRGLIFLGIGVFLLVIRYFIGGLAAETLFEIPVVKELYSIIEAVKALNFDSIHDYSWVLKVTLLSSSLSFFTYGLAVLTQPKTQKEELDEIRKDEETKHQKSLPSDKVLDTKSRAHLFAIGTTGSGKTANILRYVENSIKNGQPTIIVDGKGGTKEHDLATVSQELAKKYGRTVYLINQSDTSNTSLYNPFSDLSATEVKDMIVSMSEWESDHYKNLASRYWQIMLSVMIDNDITPTFENIILFSEPEKFLELLDEIKTRGQIDDEQYRKAVNIANSEAGKQAEISISRSAVVYEGDGSKLFGDRWGFNMRSAFEANAVVIVLLNEFSYGEFARSTGQLVLEDIKSLISRLLKGEYAEKEMLLVLEELGVYVNDGIEGLLNRSRSAGVKTIVSMQTTADVDKVNPDLTRQIIGNCNDFLIMRVTDQDSAETMAKLIGTEKGIQKTSRTSEGIGTGESSNKLVDQFRISPNEIKNFPSLFGIYYTKNKPNEVKRFKTKFVRI
jgi:type IV secretory pathway TraG/TraD family ATPase VirD4